MSTPTIYSTAQIADLAGVTRRTVQRACQRVGITRRPLVIVGAAERDRILAAIRGSVGNPDFGPDYAPKRKCPKSG